MSGSQQPLLGYGGGSYKIANSLRFRSSASAYLSRTITLSATWTLSLWVKRGKLSATSPIFGLSVGFNSNDTLTAGTLTTTAVYRDPSAWYHIVVSNSGCYVNGVSVGSVTTGILVNPSIGNYLTNYFDGYLADIYLIDGSALSATSFGQFNATTGVWEPKQYVGSYGSAGFHLNFSNGTSTTTLGYDSSGNGNNWTTNNISLTAGSTYDWMIDSPTPYQGTSYGVGNYAVLNPLDAGSASLVNANLTASQGAAWATGLSTIHPTSGKWYFEITAGGATVYSGIATQNFVFSGNNLGAAAAYGYYGSNGNFYDNGSASTSLSTYGAGDVIGVALDIDNGKLWFAKNGTWQASGDPASGANPIKSGLSASYWQLGTSAYSTTSNANFGQRPFAYTPPSGYKSLCTYNLPTPTIQNGAGYMAATTYTGNGSTQSIANTVNGVSFQPDFVWVKSRSGAYSNVLQDSVRGNYRYLVSDTTTAENTNSGYDWFKSFNSNGFTVAFTSSNSTNTGEWNSAGNTYIGWQWKAGGTAVTNTAGSITSSVSANTTSGFSVVTYTPPGSGTCTVGHGLGVTPSMIIAKSRTAVDNWPVYHVSIGAGKIVELNSTGAQSTNSIIGTSGPSSTIFNFAGVGGNWVAYCFAAIPGYSAFGSYTGNGSADGPFVYCGFRPRFVLVKRSDTANWWLMWDSSRNTYNSLGNYLQAESSNAENNNGATVYNWLDALSNGFKMRDGSPAWNASGGTYIYAAFAENPFTNALAR